MCFGVVFVDEVAVVGTNDFNVEFLRNLNQNLIDFLLSYERFMIGSFYCCLVTLQFKIVVFSKHLFEPGSGISRLFNLAVHDESWDFTTKACR